MPSDNQISPLFGNMQPSSSGDASSQTAPTPPLPDKTDSLIDALSNTAKPEPISSVSAFGNALPELPETPSIVSLPEVEMSTLPEVSLDVAPNNVSPKTISDPLIKAIETLIPIPSEIPISQTVSSVGEMKKETEELPVLDETSPSTDLEKAEKGDMSTGIGVSTVVPAEVPVDPKLSQYLHADKVYQEMIRIESQEKIRLQLAVRYTLLMFAIFLVLAWIVSNRIIMFGFSEFVWLARIRDGLFALMAGLFAMTLWFGSVSWSRHILVITVIRTLALVFFGAVVVALYIPLW